MCECNEVIVFRERLTVGCVGGLQSFVGVLWLCEVRNYKIFNNCLIPGSPWVKLTSYRKGKDIKKAKN